MSEPRTNASRVSELREAFDRSFASPPARATQEIDDLLAIRVSGERYAIRLRDIAGIVTGRKLISVPASTPALLGLAGIRAGIVPVFGLASLLGHAQASDSARWMVLCDAEEPVALGFSDFEGYLRLPQSALQVEENLHDARKYVAAVASTATGLRAVISIPLVVATIWHRIDHSRSQTGGTR